MALAEELPYYKDLGISDTVNGIAVQKNHRKR